MKVDKGQSQYFYCHRMCTYSGRHIGSRQCAISPGLYKHLAGISSASATSTSLIPIHWKRIQIYKFRLEKERKSSLMLQEGKRPAQLRTDSSGPNAKTAEETRVLERVGNVVCYRKCIAFSQGYQLELPCKRIWCRPFKLSAPTVSLPGTFRSSTRRWYHKLDMQGWEKKVSGILKEEIYSVFDFEQSGYMDWHVVSI